MEQEIPEWEKILSFFSQDEITITFGTGKITGHCYQDSICASS